MTKEELLKEAKPILFNAEMVKAIYERRKRQTRRIISDAHIKALESPYAHEHPEITEGALISKLCLPRYEVGNILYIRETWAPDPTIKGKGGYLYRVCDPSGESPLKWHPSIHMPKAAARIFLQVTAVAAERLKEIDAVDLEAEGIQRQVIESFGEPYARKMFAGLWNSTLKGEEKARYKWAENPWVWVYTFDVIGIFDREELL